MRALSTIALCSMVLGAGCLDNQESILITNAVPPSATQDGGCVFQAGGTPLLEGVVDVSFDTGYALGVVVANNLPQTTNSGIDVSEMQILDAEVRLTMPQDPAVIDAVGAIDGALTEYKLDLATNSLPGASSSTVKIDVPRPSLNAIAAAMNLAPGDERTLNINVIINAKRASNTGVANSGIVSSREFTMPVRVCHSCLRDCDATEDPDTGTDVCSFDACANDPFFVSGGACGNAQSAPVNPTCCSGSIPAAGVCG